MEIFENLDVIEPKSANKNSVIIDQSEDGKFEHRNPFEFMAIDENQFLMQVSGRSGCPKCGKSRKLFCYTCYVPIVEIEQRVPNVQLPIQIDIIKHQREVNGKSTAIHAAVLAPQNVRIYTYPNIPDYDSLDDAKTVRITKNKDIYMCSNQFDLCFFFLIRIGFNISHAQFNPCGWYF